MNVSGTGELSSTRQENAKANSHMESDLTLMKARFPWQVKEKHHLKNEISETAKTQTKDLTESNEAGSSSHKKSKPNDFVDNMEQNHKVLGEQNLNMLDSVITDSNNSILPGTSSSEEKLPYPRFVTSYENINAVKNSTNENASVPMRSATSRNYKEKLFLERWQLQQIHEAILQNEINQAFCALSLGPLFDSRSGALSQDYSNDENYMFLEMVMPPPHSSLQSDEKVIHKENTDNKTSNPERSSSNEYDMSRSYSSDLSGTVYNVVSFFPDPCMSSYKHFNEINPQQTSTNNNDADENCNLNVNVIRNSDIIDAAVSFAILHENVKSSESDHK